MKNRNWKLIPGALLIAAAIAGLSFGWWVYPSTPTAAPSTTQLRYAIADAPPAITQVAAARGIETIGYVRPGFYTSWTNGRKHFDAAKATRNIEQLRTVLKGMDWMVTDLEKTPRRIVRDPDDYEPDEVKWAIDQYTTMWKWFRAHFPDLKLSEWNLSPGRDSNDFPLAETLGLKWTDSVDVSLFWHRSPGRLAKQQKILEHAIELGKLHDKTVIAWVWERRVVRNVDRTVAVYEPLSREAIDQMLDLALSEGVDIVVLWSNSYAILAAKNPSKVIAETVGQPVHYDPMPAVTARIVSLMAEMRRRAEVLEH